MRRAIPTTWGRLMRLIGREELIDDPRFVTSAARVERARVVEITDVGRAPARERVPLQTCSADA